MPSYIKAMHPRLNGLCLVYKYYSLIIIKKNNALIQSIGQANIGGLPFLPSETELVTEMVDELITDSLESAFERAALPAGIENRLAKVDWTSRDVLIGTLRNNARLQTCLEKRFYYITAKLGKEDDLPIHYLALFQTPRIFSDKGGIYYYGEKYFAG